MNSSGRTIKIVTELSRILVGATFLFSGFVKAVDPLGFAYKIQDYLISLGLPGLLRLALPAAIVAVVLEFAIGIFLLLGIYRKPTAILAALFMAFFLPFTLWIALKNPVEDCGCFGDAWIISNWDTFYKNIVLSVGALILLFNHRLLTPLFSSSTAWMAATFTLAFGLLFAGYNTVKLPLFDFRPFKIGANIPQQLVVDPAKSEVVENIFIYSKDGVEKEFTEEDYPWNDSTWTFVEMETVVIRAGEQPKIEDFQVSILTYDSLSQQLVAGDDITRQLLSETDYTFLMLSFSLEEMNRKHLDDFKEAARFAGDHGIGFYCLTSSSPSVVDQWRDRNDFDCRYALLDERVLKTMIRSNPGLMLLQNGNVVNKWDDGDLPGFQGQKMERLANPKGLKTDGRVRFVVLLLLFVVPLLLIKRVDVNRRKPLRQL